MGKISAKLRTAIFSGVVGLLPSVAFADSGSNGAETAGAVPDHGAAEARGQGNVTHASVETTTPSVPDHATAEARGQGDRSPPPDETAASVPDHAAAERRGTEAE
jgi:hypothetical protein